VVPSDMRILVTQIQCRFLGGCSNLRMAAGSIPCEDSSGRTLILRNRVLTRPCRLQMNGVPQHEQVGMSVAAVSSQRFLGETRFVSELKTFDDLQQ
jgi:hypothetical protein